MRIMAARADGSAETPAAPHHDPWRDHAPGAGALGAFFVALALFASGESWAGVDVLIPILFAMGLAASVFGYVRSRAQSAQRIAVVGAGLNAIGLVLHVVATR
jgi:hypothetical protein